MSFVPAWKSEYVIPTLGGVCALMTIGLGSTFLVPSFEKGEKKVISFREINAVELSLAETPSAGEVFAKHLFVPERKGENIRSNSDLVIRGVYIGDRESSVILSLRSKPTVSLRVWQNDKDSVISQVTDPRSAHYPLVAFLKEWDIQKVGFSEVTFNNALTGEVETYEVDYTPVKKVADQAIAGFGQGGVLDLGGASGVTRTAKPVAANSPNSARLDPKMNAANSRGASSTQRVSATQSSSSSRQSVQKQKAPTKKTSTKSAPSKSKGKAKSKK